MGPFAQRTRFPKTLRGKAALINVPSVWSLRVAFAANVTIALFSVSIASGQNPSPIPVAGTAETVRVIVTGSNIPTAEEVGPNPVDTYRPVDMEKLGIHNTTDLLTYSTRPSTSSSSRILSARAVGVLRDPIRAGAAKSRQAQPGQTHP